MKISSWRDVALALLEFEKPYDEGDCDPDGEATIMRAGQSSKLTMTLEWPPKKEKKHETKKEKARRVHKAARV
jgi:hypothetical protein